MVLGKEHVLDAVIVFAGADLAGQFMRDAGLKVFSYDKCFWADHVRSNVFQNVITLACGIFRVCVINVVLCR